MVKFNITLNYITYPGQKKILVWRKYKF